MPKISAPTVAEHRSAQHAALLVAAEEILLDGGIESVTPSAVGSRAGLARSTFYEYFPSKDDLLIALAARTFQEWRTEVAQFTAPVPPGEARLRAYIAATLRLTADGKHGLATALRGVKLSPKSHDHLAELHDALNTPLREALGGLIADDDRLTAPLVHGVIGAAMALIVAGRPLDVVTERTCALVLDGLPR